MRQEEKNQKGRARILKYAFAEFAEQGYLGASVNTICIAGKISKGLLYHYYTDKDALYLACVEQCFQELVLIGCYVIMGFMQGYQPVASLSFRGHWKLPDSSRL